MRELQLHLEKIVKDKSSDEFQSRQGKLKDKSLYKFSASEINALKKYERDIVPMNAYVQKELNSVRNEMKDILEENVDEKYFYNCRLTDIDTKKRICAMLEPWNYSMMKRVYNPEFKSPTLTCVTGGNQEKKVYINGRARKLTPVEYERLQTLPDNYTEGVANSKRYTAVGNGWTVDVIAYIFSFFGKNVCSLFVYLDE